MAVKMTQQEWGSKKGWGPDYIPSKEEIEMYLKTLAYYYEQMKYVPVPVTKRLMNEVLKAGTSKKPNSPESVFLDEKTEMFKYEEEATYLFKDYQSLQNLCETQKMIVLGFANSILEMYKSMTIVKEEL